MTRHEVLTFASYAEVLGSARVEVQLPTRATVDDLIRALRALPGGASLPTLPLVAVNRRLAEPGAPITPGDELALLPPLAGG
jgi:molybdopterin converting factor small subunit